MPRLTDALAPVLVAGLPALLVAQDMEFHVGRWYQGNRAAIYEFRTDAAVSRLFSHGFTAQVLVDDSLGRRRAFYGAGYEVHAWRRRATLGPYAIASAAFGLSTDTSEHRVAVQWTVGGGVEWRPVSWFAAGFEARYRLEDRGPRGFWRQGPDARDGVSAAVGVAIEVRRRASEVRGAASPPPAPRLPPLSVPATITGSAADIVRTALAALGRPYQWGGTAANGFDCSGLIQYAYGAHGIRVPRMSRDQAQAGSEVAPVVEALKPGDILLFSVRPGGGVTHVGMYVGEGTFIHSSNTGVKLSRLEVHDPDGAWWIPRWIGARRVVP